MSEDITAGDIQESNGSAGLFADAGQTIGGSAEVAVPVRIDTSAEATAEVAVPPAEKLWTPNFILLWQGQLVSILGDVVYGIALGFWVLAVTGSTALMGTMMAASTLPAVLISPFAGVIADRTDRRKLLILMDIIRGAAVVLLAIAIFNGSKGIWMVFAAGIVLSTCGAFFSPAVSSTIPDIVPKSQLIGANSMMGIIQSGSNIIGNSAGGFLFQVLGAPVLFLFNGLSFVFSAFLNIFLRIPKVERKEKQHFFADMKDGYRFVWRFRGLRDMLAIISVLNFVSVVAIVLFLPLFQQTESLGPGRYGIAMAFLTGGMLVAMIATSAIKFAPERRFKVFMLSAGIAFICFSATALAENFILMCALIFIGGFFNAIINVFIHSTIQLTVPQDMRGKVFSLVSMLAQSLTPFGMLLGGILGEFFPIRVIIFVCFIVTLVAIVPFGFMKSFRRFINFDPEKETLEDIL
ncbi:MAG TPA: MFS transporter [Clostridia bacterium]|nr:MFS transporter [Clostridia bacterium]